MCLNPIFTMVLAHIFTSEKMSRPKYYAVGIALTACVFLMRPWDIQEGNTPLGLAIMLAASISFAAYTVMGKRTLAKVGTYTQTSISFILGALVLLVIILMTGRPVLAGVAEHPLTVAYVGITLLFLASFITIRDTSCSQAKTE